MSKSEPDHEWKFGDIAVHKKYGVGVILYVDYDSNEVLFTHKDDCELIDAYKLTFIRRSDIPFNPNQPG